MFPDWTDLQQVIAYADKLGPYLLVVKHATRNNYNISLLSRPDIWNRKGVTVLHTTQD